MVTNGSLTERYGATDHQYQPATMFYMQAQETHAEHFHNQGAHCFVIELDNSWLEAISHRASQVYFAQFKGGTASWLAMRLHREFRSPDESAPLAIEGLTLELIAEVSRSERPSIDKRPPRWVNLAKDLLHARFADQITNETVAKEVGVHPVHLARGFRQHLHCTVGDYVRRLRLEFACREILATDKTLTQIAHHAGFYDHSHFSRTFKELIGFTPSQYRGMARQR